MILTNHRKRRLPAFPLLLLLAAWGTHCGSSSSPSDGNGDTDGSELAYTPCALEERAGQFTVELGDGSTSVQGRVLNGVVPSNVRQVEAQEGPCRLLRGRSLFCNPACGASQTCGEDGVCIPYPTPQDVGTVQIRGLKAALSLTPNSAKFYFNGGSSLPHPGFDAGAALTLEARGAEVPAFSLRGRGIQALAVPDAPITVERGKTVAVSWTPPSDPGAARIQIVMDLAHHGGIAASLECDAVPDSGSYVIPAGLITKLLDVGVAGFPKITISRRTADSTDTSAGCVELLVLSQTERELTLPGLVSCSSDEDCPTGQSCQSDLTCR
ncbi:hypothetical protein POL68_00480 [Stigmatella sp. ncwal1]|uniref:Lipoprotein n=1 Tax=Stigmatella ashevillensis TaxID=2995309 RepID=A0ABT5D241_9BACT|nr:hypothetical protein [Stigmatella ashevillena]MDC0706938.1 hypothetical protein [Stigmatella ashevillena]